MHINQGDGADVVKNLQVHFAVIFVFLIKLQFIPLNTLGNLLV
jgi:hypothetical protein